MFTIHMKLASEPLLGFGLGHCQVTYFCRNEANERLVYCLQYRGKHWSPKIALLRCSQDGEPSHEVSFGKNYKVIFQRPWGNSNTETAAREWIDCYEKETEEAFLRLMNTKIEIKKHPDEVLELTDEQIEYAKQRFKQAEQEQNC